MTSSRNYLDFVLDRLSDVDDVNIQTHDGRIYFVFQRKSHRRHLRRQVFGQADKIGKTLDARSGLRNAVRGRERYVAGR